MPRKIVYRLVADLRPDIDPETSSISSTLRKIRPRVSFEEVVEQGIDRIARRLPPPGRYCRGRYRLAAVLDLARDLERLFARLVGRQVRAMQPKADPSLFAARLVPVLVAVTHGARLELARDKSAWIVVDDELADAQSIDRALADLFSHVPESIVCTCKQSSRFRWKNKETRGIEG